MKRLMTLALALTVVLAGCGGAATTEKKETTTTTTTPAAAPAPKKPEKLVIGFVPSQDAAGIESKVEPLNKFLSGKLGIPVTSFVGTDFMGVIEAMGSEKVDVGFLNPMGYVLANSSYQTQVILKTMRKGSGTYRAQLTARKADNIPVCDAAKDAKCTATFQALKGKRIAFVDQASTSGYLFPASFMKGAGIDIEKGKFFSDVIMAGQHDAAAKLVLNNGADASWTFEDIRDNFTKDIPDIKDKLVPVAYTAPIPNDTVSVRKGLPADFVAQFKAALLEYAGTAEGKDLLKNLYTIDGFVDGNDKDYDVVRNMAKDMGVDIKSSLTKKK